MSELTTIKHLQEKVLQACQACSWPGAPAPDFEGIPNPNRIVRETTLVQVDQAISGINNAIRQRDRENFSLYLSVATGIIFAASKETLAND